MEIRNRKVIINSVGGTASKAAVNYKISLPAPWVRQMGIKEHDRDVEIVFNDNEILIRRKKND